MHNNIFNGCMGVGISQLVQCCTCDQKTASSNPSRNRMKFFPSRLHFLCRLLFSVCSNPIIQQWHLKDSSHSAKCAGSRLLLNMNTPYTQLISSGLTTLSSLSVGTYPGNELTCNLSGNAWPQSSQFKEWNWCA